MNDHTRTVRTIRPIFFFFCVYNCQEKVWIKKFLESSLELKNVYYKIETPFCMYVHILKSTQGILVQFSLME